MNTQLLIIFAILALVNAIAFLIMLTDKIKSAREGSPRISEGMLFFMASAFGSIGVYAGMFLFRHKTRKWYFLVGVPLLVIQNFALAFLIYQLVVGEIIISL